MAQKPKVFDFDNFDLISAVKPPEEISERQKFEQAQQLMRLIDMLYVENPRLTEAKKLETEPLKPVEKTEPPSGKRKIIL